MCYSKADGGQRCEYHSRIDYEKAVQRCDIYERIISNGETLTRDERIQVLRWREDPSSLTPAEKNRLSQYLRVFNDDSTLTPTEVKNYEKNLATIDATGTVLDVSAVVGGWKARKELELLRYELLEEYAERFGFNREPVGGRSTPEVEAEQKELLRQARSHLPFMDRWRRMRALKQALAQHKKNPDTPLTPLQQKTIDDLYRRLPDLGKDKVIMSNGKSSQISVEKFDALRDRVARYESIHPTIGVSEYTLVAHKSVQALRKNPEHFAVLTKKNPTNAEVASLPKAYRDLLNKPRLLNKMLSHAYLQDQRVAEYAVLSEKASSAFPRKYVKSADRNSMDEARAVLPLGPRQGGADYDRKRREFLTEQTKAFQAGDYARVRENSRNYQGFNTLPRPAFAPASKTPVSSSKTTKPLVAPARQRAPLNTTADRELTRPVLKGNSSSAKKPPVGSSFPPPPPLPPLPSLPPAPKPHPNLKAGLATDDEMRAELEGRMSKNKK